MTASSPPQDPEPNGAADRLPHSAGAVSPRGEAAGDALPSARGLRIQFPAELPISRRVADIRAAILGHQVVIVAGATGSGKTTQLPKIALELGRGRGALIGVTQPRRIAATSVAARVATELDCPLGDEVGYQIRFGKRTSDRTRLTFMTDGILLAEIQSDRLLRRYDTLIIDEAHERSLNIDFVLGWLARILPKRPDLKLIISSATIETERFSAFFGGAPILDVEGRTYPVDVLYEPPDPELDLPVAVANAVENVISLDPHGDILAFLPGEREIRETEHELSRRELMHTTVQPLYARLSATDQAKVFASVVGRRIILATNVAETSLTLPGIVYVVDTGVARLSRYDPRTGTTRLQIEAISRASADQRKGRCGRVREGICVRLYEEASYDSRPAFTDPEIKRTGLAGVILRMKALGLGDVEEFPFLDAPNPRSINEGYRVLEELGALNAERRLTPLGSRLARFPVDPRLGRMILAGADGGCLRQILVLAAALELNDPRERPRGLEQKADQLHRRFADDRSDFVGLLRLWEFVQSARQKGTGQLKRACKDNFLSFVRVREWMEVERQLRELVRELGIERGTIQRDRRAHEEIEQGTSKQRTAERGTSQPGAVAQGSEPAEPLRSRRGRRRRRNGASGDALSSRTAPADQPAAFELDSSDALHQALLGGLLSRIGHYHPEQRVYVGARQTRFVIHPSSALAKKSHAWVMAYELVQTTQLFARTAARFDPVWLDEVASHLLKRSYSAPHWSESAARAKIRERATLFGLPVLEERSVDYARVAPVRARLMFLEHALVRGEYESRGAFQAKNRELLAEVSRLRDKARKSDMLADEDTLLAFFDQRVPASVTDGKGFEAWREKAELEEPTLLHLALSDVITQEERLAPEDYPDVLSLHGVELPLSYRFDPSADDDGVTVNIPLALLPSLQPGELDWTIPAWHEDKVRFVLETLSRAERRALGSAPELAREVASRLLPFQGPFLPALSRVVFEVTGVDVPPEAFRLEAVPPYLRLFCRLLGERGQVIAQSRDLALLIREHGAHARQAFERAERTSAWERTGLSSWSIDQLPEFVTREVAGTKVRAYPALLDRGTHVDLTLLESSEVAEAATRAGIRRLCGLALSKQLAALCKRSPPPFPRTSPLPPSRVELDAFRDRLSLVVVEEAFALQSGPLPRTKAAFQDLVSFGQPRLDSTFERVSKIITAASAEHAALERALAAAAKEPSGTHAARDIRAQLDRLVPGDVLLTTPLQNLQELPRYLRAAQIRLTRAISDPRKDADKLAPLLPVWSAFLDKFERARDRPSALQLRWAFEELRVAIFAPEVKSAQSVSLQAVSRAVDGLR